VSLRDYSRCGCLSRSRIVREYNRANATSRASVPLSFRRAKCSRVMRYAETLSRALAMSIREGQSEPHARFAICNIDESQVDSRARTESQARVKWSQQRSRMPVCASFLLEGQSAISCRQIIPRVRSGNSLPSCRHRSISAMEKHFRERNVS